MSRRWLAWLAWFIERAGWPGLLGILLLAAAAYTQARLLPQLAAETEQLRDEAARLAARRTEPVKREEPGLAARLSGAGHTPEAVARLFAAAAHAGLQLDQGEYRLQTDPAAGLTRYQITLPVEGSWPALREFLGQALNGDPALALEGITLNRPRVEERELQGVLRLTLYLSREAGK